MPPGVVQQDHATGSQGIEPGRKGLVRIIGVVPGVRVDEIGAAGPVGVHLVEIPLHGVGTVSYTQLAFKGMGKPGAEVTASTGTAVMFVEVTYQYQPIAFAAWLGPRVIRTTAAFNIREGRDLQGPAGGDGVYNPSPAATKMTCT